MDKGNARLEVFEIRPLSRFGQGWEKGYLISCLSVFLPSDLSKAKL
jgi:hypothetical protein